MVLADTALGRKIDEGTKTLDLYEPPVPSISQLSTQSAARKNWRPYRGKASVRFNVYVHEACPGSLTPSLPSDDEDDAISPVSLHLKTRW